LLLGSERAKVLFSHETTLNVEKLWIPSLITHQPDRFDIPFYMGAALNFSYLRKLKDQVLSSLPAIPQLIKGKRIYLSRTKNQMRRAGNSEDVENLFKKYGFDIVYPGTLSFLQQVALFASAEVIAGAGGAAFSNILFCNEGTRILCLVSERVKDYPVFSNLAK